MSDLRDKRIWTVGDFARWIGISHKSARTTLMRLNEELGGTLLTRTKGKNRCYTFAPSLLARAKPELFDRIVTLEERVGQLEDDVEELRTSQAAIVSQVRNNSRALAAR